MLNNSCHVSMQPKIRDLAIIGDKKTAALVDKSGAIVWYCPWRFDQPSVFSRLLDVHGGSWWFQAPDQKFIHRHYLDDSAVLLSNYVVSDKLFTVTDWMPLNSKFNGLCRKFSLAPVNVAITIHCTPGYGREKAKLSTGKSTHEVFCKQSEFYIKASHPLEILEDQVLMTLPAGSTGWLVMLDDKRQLSLIDEAAIQTSLVDTTRAWRKLMGQVSFSGAYQNELYQSYKFIQLLSHKKNGGIIAAATTSLPEVPGGDRNWDYRYVWLRDTAMIVSALIRAESQGQEAERFLDFLCMGRNTNKANLFIPFYDLDGKIAPEEKYLPVSGYLNSLPVRIGNGAYEQLQLDAQANILLAAKQVYRYNNAKPHWKTVAETADFLADHWQLPDHGIWEEQLQEHFTSSKVIAAKSLEFIADYAENEKQHRRWLSAAEAIRKFVTDHCLTADGAYAVFAGSNNVDITSALYPVWLYDEPRSNVMMKTIERLEAEYREGDLYHRRLELFDAMKEGVFLAGSLWMAQYFVMLKDLYKAKRIIDAVLEFATDLGMLPEEGCIKSGEPLGNIPQTFVHASLIGVILDYNKAAKQGLGSSQ